MSSIDKLDTFIPYLVIASFLSYELQPLFFNKYR